MNRIVERFLFVVAWLHDHEFEAFWMAFGVLLLAAFFGW